MRRSRLSVPLTVIAALVLAVSAASAREQHFSVDLVPEFNLPHAETPPTIDGRVRPGEWDDAVQLQGVTGAHNIKYFGRQTIFWWAWDAEHLYMATRSSIRPGERLAKQKRQQFTQGVVFDDSYEFGIDLMDRNKRPDETSFFYKFILNAVEAGEYQKIYPSIGQSMFNWYPRFDMANTRWEDEDGRRWWDMEIAMDLDDLQMPRPHRAGDLVKLLMARDYKWPWEQVCIPSATGFLVSRGFPRATLTANQPYAQVERLEGLLDQKVNLAARIVNPGGSPVDIQATVRVRDAKNTREPGAETLWQVQKRYALSPGQSERLVINRDVPEPRAFLDVEIMRVEDEESHPVYTYHAFFQRDPEKKFMEYRRTPPDFPLQARFNPVQSKLWLAGDTLDAQVDNKDAIAAMTWVVKDGNREIASGRVDQTVYWKYQELIELPTLDPGQYSVTATLVDAEDKNLLTRTSKFTRKNEAREFSEWWNNDIGSPDQILKPFEPIGVRKKTTVQVSPVLRTYDLDALGLPRSIKSSGGEVLSSPARIVVISNGQTYRVPTEGTVTVTKEKPWRVHFKGSSSAAGIRFSAAGKIEQDGLTDIQLTYEPAGDPVRIEELRIEWPVDDTLRNYMVVIGPGGNYCTREIGAVPAGNGVVWDTLHDLGTQGSGMTKGNFYGNVWVGTEKRGLLWAGDSDRGWVPSDTTAAHSLKRGPNTVIIRNHIIGTAPDEKPFTLDGARTIRFQYNASPFKPLDKGFRVNMRSAGNGFGGQPGYMLNEEEGIDGWHLLHPPTKDMSEWPEWYARWMKHNVKRNRRGLYSVGARQKRWNDCQIPLRGYGPKSIVPGVYGYFRADWLPQDSGDEVLTETYTDYTHWLMDRMAEEGGIRQFYYDIAFASKIMTNLTSGDGYILPDGRTQPEAGDDELRQYAMRSYAMMQENGVYPTGVSGHATNAFCLKALPWFDAMLDSEYPMKDPVGVYTPERMIAMSCPHAFGTGINHLGQMDARWAAMHDASSSGASEYRRQTFDNPAFQHWGVTFDDVQFIPYWRNDDYARRVRPGLLASMWKRPHSVVVGVINYGPDAKGFEKERKLGLTLDMEALGIPTGLEGQRLRVREFVTHGKRLEAINLNATTGALTGSEIAYHKTHFIVIHWENSPIEGDWTDEIEENAWPAALDWGINRAKRIKTGRGSSIVWPDDSFKVRAWQGKNSVLLKIANTSPETRTTTLQLDIAELGVRVDPEEEKWLRFTRTYNIGGSGKVSYDGYSGTLKVTLDGGEEKYVTVDKF